MKGWRRTVRVRKEKKEGKTKIHSNTMCTHSKWANKQTPTVLKRCENIL